MSCCVDKFHVSWFSSIFLFKNGEMIIGKYKLVQFL